MKKLRILFFMTSFLLIFFTSCTRYNDSDIGYLNGVQGSLKYEPVVEFKDKKVSAEVGLNVLFGFITWADGDIADQGMTKSTLNTKMGKLKSAAVYKACRKARSDVLLAVKYDIETTDYFLYRKIKCRVQGFPANIIGIQETKNLIKAKRK